MGQGAEIPAQVCATPGLELFPSCFAAAFDEYSFGHVESQIPIGHTGGDVQKELNIQNWGGQNQCFYVVTEDMSLTREWEKDWGQNPEGHQHLWEVEERPMQQRTLM